MHIVGFKVVDLREEPEPGLYRATLLLRTRSSQISLFVRTLIPNDSSSEHIRRILIDDAIRQVRRLPEYRDGTLSITVDEMILKGLSEGD